MDIVYLTRDFAACLIAVLFYCILMSLPKKALIASSVLGALTYLMYRIIFLFGYEMAGYLAATLFAALSSEILARVMKMPTTIFVFPGIIPLVPGVGLHNSMLCLINNDISGFVHQGIKTLFISGTIAVTVAVVNASFRNFTAKNAGSKGFSPLPRK